MNPIKVSKDLEKALVSYLVATFDVNRDGKEPELAAAMRRSFETRGALFKGPFLELNTPYRKGHSLKQLSDNGVLSPELLELPWPMPIEMPLYAHQEYAIRRLCQDQRNVVVSSGTGSGKTESFLIPILNDLLIDPTPGVRALLIYPMNALVNDQLERLRVLLKGTGITFGRYTSELADTDQEARKRIKNPLENEVISREEIRNRRKLPQILITNYAMLEYLLLRPDDSPLFETGAWRFIVLDEAHSYAGAQGSEISLLLRRLKQRLNAEPGEIRCIATSATLTTEDADKAAEFASNLFNDEFTAEDIIFGEIDPDFVEIDSNLYQPEATAYLADDLNELLAATREGDADLTRTLTYLDDISLIPKEAVAYADMVDASVPLFLWHALKNNGDLIQLRQWMLDQGSAVLVEDAANYLFKERLQPQPLDVRLQALYHLIELGALARPSDDKPPLLPARYHLFARSPQGLWACVNPSCSGRSPEQTTKWSRLFSMRRETCDSCGAHVYPITVCRTCGQVYLRMFEQGKTVLLAEADPFGNTEQCYFSWDSIVENTSLLDDEGDETDLSSKASDNRYQDKKEICLNCQHYANRCTCSDGGLRVVLYQVISVIRGKDGEKPEPIREMNECFRCRDKSLKGTEIVTEITLGDNQPVAVLMNGLYRNLPEAPASEQKRLPGKGRKLLAFSDTRQGAARFAAYLQDVVNTEHYKHVIIKALQDWEQNSGRDYLPDLHALSDRATGLAWNEYQIFQNDQFITDDIDRRRRELSGAQKGRLQAQVKADILAEFTVRRKQRQSLEGLGFIAVEYFEPDKHPDYLPLAQQLNLTSERAAALVHYLLDDLRQEKLVELPADIPPDHEVFGKNIANTRLVLRNPQVSESAWIGATPRHRRRRMVQTILKQLKMPDTDENVIKALDAVWAWLLNMEENYRILVGSASEGYRLSTSRMFFHNKDVDWYRCERCQRLQCRGNSLPCPRCGGRLIPADLSANTGFYRQVFTRDLIPMRVEEHTAQLDPAKGRDYQEWFKAGEINVLSCSTTFEMGIDLGDLQAVVMNNVPPTVANYRQRSGRAGRRVSGTAFILTWARGERPHDQTYFNQPERIISGEVRVPYLAMDNPFIHRRHVNAILFSDFLRYRNAGGRGDLNRVGSFFDPQTLEGCHYDALEKWAINREEEINRRLEAFGMPLTEQPPHDAAEQGKSHFFEDMEKAHAAYESAAGYYRKQIQEMAAQIASMPDKAKEIGEEIQRFSALLNRLNEDELISYLSNKGVLPSYSFPLHTVELTLPPVEAAKAQLRLQRDLRQAIREYAPGSEVVADKRIWRSAALEFFRKTPQLFHYYICPNCHYLEIGRAAGMSLTRTECPLCGERIKRQYQFLTPDGFRADWRSGTPAGQFVNTQPNLMQSGLVARELPELAALGELVWAAYQREGELLYVNEGVRGRGFKICMDCGKALNSKDKKCTNRIKGQPCSGKRIETLVLGHKIETDTLHLHFEPAPYVGIKEPEDQSFWLSLTTALLQGAARALQIERRDIDGVLFPRKSKNGRWEQTIVLYDNVAGGAGHVRHIRDNFLQVVEEALQVVNCSECAEETSCYHCLRDYNNQLYHHLLRRQGVIQFLEAIRASLDPMPYEVRGTGKVVAVNVPRWLLQQCRQARKQLILAADEIKRGAPDGEILNWLETIQDLLQRGVEVHLYLREIPMPSLENAEKLSIAGYFQFLQKEYGDFHLYQIGHLPEWQILMDPDDTFACRAIRQIEEGDFVLGTKTGQGGLLTTFHHEGVDAAMATFNAITPRLVESSELEMPAGTRVINVKPGNPITEAALFQEIFARPVTHLFVNDRYLIDEERIVNRLGAYVDLAHKAGSLQSVTFQANEAGRGGTSGTHEEQQRAIRKLKHRFSNVDIQAKLVRAKHDRFIELTRTDGSKARILIGRGLDFISSDGRIEPTYIVIEDPYVEKRI